MRLRMAGAWSAFACVVLGSLLGCAHATRMANGSPLQPTKSNDWADSVLRTMSLRDKAAQMVWPTVLGDYAAVDSREWRALVRDVEVEHVGGFTASIGSPVDLAVKLNALQRASPLPLLFGSDFEYGAGQRARGGTFLPNGIDLGGATVFPPEMAFGATRDTMLAYEEGRITAREGRALGVQIDYAPVLDVNNNPNNPVINTRSYGESPTLDAAFGSAFIRGLQEHGMIATGKHFPGHGDTETNSHLALPVVNVSRARLDSVELVPFRAAIATGVGAIMSFHGSMPALDSSGAPGTLSPLVLTDLLRHAMHFNGVIFSDAMDMRGVLDRYGPVEAAKRAVAAGADVLIQPQNVGQAIDAIVAGVREGRYPESRIDSSARRLLEFKSEMQLNRQRFVDLDSVQAIVGDSADQAVAQTVADRSITLVKDSLNRLPLGDLPASTRVLSITIAHRADLDAGVTFAATLRGKFPGLRADYINADAPGDVPAALLSAADSASVVIVSSYVGQQWDATTVGASAVITAFIQQLVHRGARPIVVALGNPYFLEQVPSVGTYVVGWGGFPMSQRAAAQALLGAIPITGTLPISLAPYANFGAGIQRPATPPAVTPPVRPADPDPKHTP